MMLRWVLLSRSHPLNVDEGGRAAVSPGPDGHVVSDVISDSPLKPENSTHWQNFLAFAKSTNSVIELDSGL